MNTIVVGIDGSPQSREALRWAAAEARLRGAALRVVHAWNLPYRPIAPSFIPELDPRDIEAAKRHADGLIEEELAELGDLGELEVERVALEDSPAAALITAAADADLLVVGSRGRGGFTGLLLGSVSQQCAHHAPCPIVIVSGKN